MQKNPRETHENRKTKKQWMNVDKSPIPKQLSYVSSFFFWFTFLYIITYFFPEKFSRIFNTILSYFQNTCSEVRWMWVRVSQRVSQQEVSQWEKGWSRTNVYPYTVMYLDFILEVKLWARLSVRRSVGRLVGRPVCHNFSKGMEVTLPTPLLQPLLHLYSRVYDCTLYVWACNNYWTRKCHCAFCKSLEIQSFKRIYFFFRY